MIYTKIMALLAFFFSSTLIFNVYEESMRLGEDYDLDLFLLLLPVFLLSALVLLVGEKINNNIFNIAMYVVGVLSLIFTLGGGVLGMLWIIGLYVLTVVSLAALVFVIVELFKKEK